ncbi:hypothetical protein HK097_008415 [Rhizophlyctis rosea]|uniref:RRM domain-containing protein n=1 Tax=Rhizophlyctis rosea TaxID=64517 RepID=A0AAD5SAA3_9FUNG|nr:hypothetical protein HK097_008415 [Rhizophlyctis rosea]
MSRRNTTLFVAGISPRTRARDLAYEFERYGRLVRCDIPAPRHQSSKPSYAFVEFEDYRDAEEAYYEMQHRKVDGYSLSIQWAKNAPGRNWRYDDRRDDDRRRSSRSRSPRSGSGRGGRSGRSASPVGRRDDDKVYRGDEKRDNDGDVKMENVRAGSPGANGHKDEPRRSHSPANNGRRSQSPDDRGRRDDRDDAPRGRSGSRDAERN